MTEKELQYEIRRRLGSRKDIRLWRNNVGKLRDARGKVVIFGLCPGSSDLIGMRQIMVTEEMVGQTVAQFVAIEVKGPKGKPSAAQEKFLEVARQLGGVGILAKKLEDISILLE